MSRIFLWKNDFKISKNFLNIVDNSFKIYQKIILNFSKFYETFLMYIVPKFLKIFLNLFHDLLEIFQYFFKVPPQFFPKITQYFPLYIVTFSLMITWPAYCWQDQPSYRSYHLQSSILIYWSYGGTRIEFYCFQWYQ